MSHQDMKPLIDAVKSLGFVVPSRPLKWRHPEGTLRAELDLQYGGLQCELVVWSWHGKEPRHAVLYTLYDDNDAAPGLESGILIMDFNLIDGRWVVNPDSNNFAQWILGKLEG